MSERRPRLLVKRPALGLVLSFLLASPALAASAPNAPTVTFLYSLATNTGVLPLTGASLSWEPTRKELFVTFSGLVRVFNDTGMETFTFGEDRSAGGITGVVPLENGHVIALTHLDGKLTLLECNFRGEPIGPIVLRGLPETLGPFVPSTIRSVNQKLYLLDNAAMKVVVATPEGEYVTSYELEKVLGLKEGERPDTGIRGFNVDAEGNMLFTIQPLFRAFLVTPDGEVRAWGVRGSVAGKFNVVGGIARDRAGYIYVVDILRSVVMIFDRNLQFLHEFGYRGASQSSLAAPDDITVGDGKIYVSNNSRRGVSVFRVELAPEASDVVVISKTPKPATAECVACDDDDSDGLVNKIDACPKEPGPARLNGCPDKDTDGDGILDSEDACPTRKGPIENKGCPLTVTIKPAPEPEPSPPKKNELVIITKEKLVIKEKVLFETAKAVVLPRSFELLNQVAAILLQHTEAPPVVVEGHTDSRGGAEMNLKLSQARAESVRAYLVQHGVDPGRLKATGFGLTRPIASNFTSAGREANRRVEFMFETAEYDQAH